MEVNWKNTVSIFPCYNWSLKLWTRYFHIISFSPFDQSYSNQSEGEYQLDLENMSGLTVNKICPSISFHPSSSKSPNIQLDRRLLYLLFHIQQALSLKEPLPRFIAVYTMFVVWQRKPKATDPWLVRATVWARVADWIAQTSIRQPSCITLIQPQKLPCCKQLTNFGNLSTVFSTGLDCHGKVELLTMLQEVHLSLRRIEQ